MPKRVVHYVSDGIALAFPCYYTDLRQHLDSGYVRRAPLTGWEQTRYRIPNPKRATNLRKVTCPECWREIAGMVKARSL